MVVTRFLQPVIDPQFHEDWYRVPPKEIGERCPSRCAAAMLALQFGALDLDIKAFFETPGSWALDACGSSNTRHALGRSYT